MSPSYFTANKTTANQIRASILALRGICPLYHTYQVIVSYNFMDVPFLPSSPSYLTTISEGLAKLGQDSYITISITTVFASVKPLISPTEQQFCPSLKIADTGCISRFSKSFDHLNVSEIRIYNKLRKKPAFLPREKQPQLEVALSS